MTNINGDYKTWKEDEEFYNLCNMLQQKRRECLLIFRQTIPFQAWKIICHIKWNWCKVISGSSNFTLLLTQSASKDIQLIVIWSWMKLPVIKTSLQRIYQRYISWWTNMYVKIRTIFKFGPNLKIMESKSETGRNFMSLPIICNYFILWSSHMW